MFVVYAIINNINNKYYIGSSVRYKKRWKEHINAAKNPNDSKYNYPLYRAFRKYGIENFTFKIISDDFNSIYEMEEYEQQMIDTFNSLAPYGYNQIRETHSNNIASENQKKYILKISQKCAKVNSNNEIIEVYCSYHDAAEKNGYDRDNGASIIRRICKGMVRSNNNDYFRDLDDNNIPIIPQYQTSARKKLVYAINADTLEEYYYESISDASRKLNIDRQSISDCMSGKTRYSIVHNLIFRQIDENGDIIEISGKPSIDEKIEDYNNSNPVINGVRHSIKEWCQIYNITTATYYNRRKKGMGVIEAIITPKRR